MKRYLFKIIPLYLIVLLLAILCIFIKANENKYITNIHIVKENTERNVTISNTNDTDNYNVNVTDNNYTEVYNEPEPFDFNSIYWVRNRDLPISAEEYYIFARLVYLENGAYNSYECTYLTASVVVNRLTEYGSFTNVAFADGQYSTAYNIFDSNEMNELTLTAIRDAYNNPVSGIYYQCMGHLFDEYYELYKEVDGECFYYGGE